MQVEKIAELLEPAQALRDLAKLVVAQIEHPQVAQVADAVGNLGQVVVGEDKCLQVSPIPNLLGHDTQRVLPQG